MDVRIAMTVSGRIQYLTTVLESWRRVRDVDKVPWLFSVEPGTNQAASIEIIQRFLGETGANGEILRHEYRQGVLENPYRCMASMFNAGADFAILAEEDLVVADDVLEYMAWAAFRFERQARIFTVHGHTHQDGPDHVVEIGHGFSPWIWGTWRNRWVEVIEPTWDHAYSTYNGTPGNQSGWDWNLNTRVMPERDLRSIWPVASRVQNIGRHGAHANPADFEDTQVPFRPDKPQRTGDPRQRGYVVNFAPRSQRSS
jgi:hypothetical protein